MNNYIYCYEDLPIIRLVCHYSVWWVANGKVYIYLYEDMMKASQCYYLMKQSCIVMSSGLTKRLLVKNKNNLDVITINSAIGDAKQFLLSYNNPQWLFFEEKIIDKSIYHYRFDVSVVKLLNELKDIIKLHCGDIDIDSISDIVNNIKTKFDSSKEDEFYIDEYIYRTNDGSVIIVDIKKIEELEGCNLFDCFRRKSHYLIKYIVTKPYNVTAKKICEELINTEINNKINYLKKYDI